MSNIGLLVYALVLLAGYWRRCRAGMGDGSGASAVAGSGRRQSGLPGLLSGVDIDCQANGRAAVERQGLRRIQRVTRRAGPQILTTKSCQAIVRPPGLTIRSKEN